MIEKAPEVCPPSILVVTSLPRNETSRPPFGSTMIFSTDIAMRLLLRCSDKRSLVLFGLDQEAHERVCMEFQARYGHLQNSDPQTAAEAFVQFFGERVSFVRPSIYAALELGAVDFMSRLEANINLGLDAFMEVLRLAVPDSEDRDLGLVGRTVRRVVLAGLMDRSVTRSEIEGELRAVISGVPVGRRLTAAVASAG